MADDAPALSIIDSLNLVLGEDQLRGWMLRWRAANQPTRALMEQEVMVKSALFGPTSPQRVTDRRLVRVLLERAGLEDADKPSH